MYVYIHFFFFFKQKTAYDMRISDWSSDVCSSDLFIGFGPSSLDFELEFDVFDPDFEKVYQARHQIGLGILKKFNEAGLEFAYPTQTTFTAAPDGQMIMPYAEIPLRNAEG